MAEKIKKEELLKEMEDVKSLISNLEDEYRKANISEKNYQELKEKYSKKLEEIQKKLGVEKEEKPKGIFGKLFGKKENVEEKKVEEKKTEEKKEIEVGEIEEMTPEVIEKLAQQVAEESGATGSVAETEEVPEEKTEAPASIEIEKLKVMIDTVREANKTVEESIRSISESIGELRSMIFQMEGSNREIALKLEKMEDEIAEVKPKEIEKKFNEVNTKIEKQNMAIEKLEAISKDLANKINEVSKILKKVGGIENLVDINKEIQKKIEEMKEAISYTERLAFKTEKVFMDLSKSLSDFAVYKARQENLEDMTKDILKSVDELNLKLEGFSTKKDLELVKGDILVIQKQIEEINKVLPAIQTKIPEPIAELKKEKEDIMLFLDSLEDQLKKGVISIGEYERVKKENLQRLKEIDTELKEKWEKIIEALSKGEAPEVEGKEEVAEEEKKVEEVAETETKEEESEIKKEEEKPLEAEKTEKIVKKEEEKKVETIKKKKTKENEEEKSEKNEEEKPSETPEEEKTKREEMVDILKKIKEKLK
jgi:chromosome segregation ATPase